MHYQAGTTCHVAVAVISRPPLPHTQAGRWPLLICHLQPPVHHTDNTRHTPHRRAWPLSLTDQTSNTPTKPLCDAGARELGSHRLPQLTTAAREVLELGHLGIALHPPVHPASRSGSPSTSSQISAVSAAAPT